MTPRLRNTQGSTSNLRLPTAPVVRHLLHRYRRPFAIVLGALALLVAAAAARTNPEPTTTVITANRAIKAGHTLTQDDLDTTQWPTALGAQAGYFSDFGDAVGRMTAGPLAPGEPLNAGRIVGPSLLDDSALHSGTNSHAEGSATNPPVAAIVRLADKAYLALARPGDYVNILGADSQTIGDYERENAGASDKPIPKAVVLAEDARVLAIPGSDPESGVGAAVGLQSQNTESVVVLAVNQDTAAALAGASTRYRLSMVVSPSQTADAQRTN